MSAHVIWDIVRRESSFLRKSNGIELSAEPFNLSGKNSFAASGLSQSKAVGMSLVPVGGKFKGEKIRFSTRTKKASQPKKAAQTTFLNHGFKRAVKVIKESTKKPYRADLSRTALAKYALLHAAITKVKAAGVVQPKKTRRALRK